MNDHRTQTRNYSLPHPQNDGQQDCQRIRDSLTAIDGDINALIDQTDHLQLNKADQSDVNNIQQQVNEKTPIGTTEALQTELANLSALVFANL